MSNPLDEEAYINAEFVDMVTQETWDFPVPYWEVNDVEDVIPATFQPNFFIVFPTVIEAIEEFIEKLKGDDDNGNDFTRY